MANEYECKIEVSGAADAVQAFVTHFGDRFSLSAFAPIPESTPSPGAWTSRNWGVRSDINCEGGFRIEDGNAVKEFGALGGAPIRAFTKLAKKHPALVFALFYLDPAGQIAGTADWEDGELVDEEEFGFDDYEEIEGLSPWHGERASVYADDADTDEDEDE